ncbi:unnamed protein product [Phaeothamnion confervicola]
MGAKASKPSQPPPPAEKAAPPEAVPIGAVNRRRRVSVSAEVDASSAPSVKKVIPKTDEEEKEIHKAISSNFLFSSLPAEQMKEVVDAMEAKKYAPGDVVIKEGDPGDYFYVVASGTLDVFIAGKNDGAPVRRLVVGGAFGELALMYNAPRSATVKAALECEVWALDRKTFRGTIMESGQARRKKYEEFLASVEILKAANLAHGELAQLADAVEPVSFDGGVTIIEQARRTQNERKGFGDADRETFKFYIVEEGEAHAYISKEGEQVLMSVLRPGEYFGEKALVEKTPRTATVKAAAPLKCASLGIAAFERLMGPCEEILKDRATKEYLNVEDVRSGKVSPKGSPKKGA